MNLIAKVSKNGQLLMLQQLSCIKVKHILKDYFLGFYKYILQYCFEDFPLKMYTLSVLSQGVPRHN